MAKAKAPFPVRLSDELRAKLGVLAEHERRRPSELVRLLIEDAVAAHEAEHGPLPTPAPPAAGAAGGA